MRRETHALLLVVLLGTVGCDGGRRLAGVSDSAFVATMAELRGIENRPGLDSAQRAAARDSALQRRGLTPERLERAAEALATQPQRALEIWQAIDAKVREAPAAP